VKRADAMQTLFMSELTAGANVWDARGHVMSGSNDMAEREVIYQWIDAHEDIFGKTRTPIGDIGVYFSDSTRNYYPVEFLESYRGTLLMLLQSHRQFQIVSARTLKDFAGKVLVLPDVRILSDEEAQLVRHYAGLGGHVVIAGDVDGKLSGLAGAIHLPDDPARQYLARAADDYGRTEVNLHSGLLDAVSVADTANSIKVAGTKNLVAHAATIDGVWFLFIANFEGLIAGEQLTPVAQTNIRVEVPASFGTSMHLLPFLGVESVLKGSRKGGRVSFVVPRIERGAVVWFK
jgi:hypothetical protein